MSKRSTLYWIGTPRHFLIAAGMAVGEADVSDAHILTISSQGYVDGISTVLDRWSESPFSQTSVAPPRPRGKSLMLNRIRVARSLARYRRMATRANYTDIRLFQGTNTAAHAYLYEIKRISPHTRRVVLDDGGINYNNQFAVGGRTGEGYPMWKLVAGNLLYGRAWTAVRRNGIGEVIDEIHLMAPELAREEWSSLEIVKLSPKHLWRLTETDLPGIYLDLYGCDAKEIAGIEAVFILSRSDGLLGDPKGYVKTVHTLIDLVRRRGLRTAVKYHPKEPIPDYLGLKHRADVIEIPRHLPMELLFLVGINSLQVVLGDTSTALIASPWILPDCKAISFVNMVSKLPELIYPEFQRFGVSLIDNEHEFEKLLLSA